MSHPAAGLDVLTMGRSGVDLAVRFVPKAQGAGPLLFEEEVQVLDGLLRGGLLEGAPRQDVSHCGRRRPPTRGA